MNKNVLFLCLVTLAAAPVFAESATPASPPASTPASTPAAAAPVLTYFDLDFRGGTPGQLVAAMQEAMHRPVNVIVPDEHADWKLPPLKMTHVTVPQLFRTFELSGNISTMVDTGNGSFQQISTRYGFRTLNLANINPTDDNSIWYFFVEGSPSLPTVSKFYNLSPYLDSGLTVDDITTAIQTSWKLRGETNPPKLSFHKETKLLIAVGNYAALGVITSVLQALEPAKPKAAAEKPAEAAKTKS